MKQQSCEMGHFTKCNSNNQLVSHEFQFQKGKIKFGQTNIQFAKPKKITDNFEKTKI